MPETQKTTPRFIGTREFARIFDLHVVSVRRLIREGEIPARKVGAEWKIPRAFIEKENAPPPNKASGGAGG